MTWFSCFCGCKQPASKPHHVIYQQELRRIARTSVLDQPGNAEALMYALVKDWRNLVPVAVACHARHHSGIVRYELERLPDSVYGFAVEVMGAGRAYEFLNRRYAGTDWRLDALLEDGIAA